MSSPYHGLRQSQWQAKTREVAVAHPLDMTEVVEVVLLCWRSILRTKIGGKAQIGVHVFPRPQITGTFLHELIPLEFGERYPGTWRREETSDENDIGLCAGSDQVGGDQDFVQCRQDIRQQELRAASQFAKEGQIRLLPDRELREIRQVQPRSTSDEGPFRLARRRRLDCSERPD